ncbi:MAG: SMI1/KNR4 family protein [Myxococcota bacterium]
MSETTRFRGRIIEEVSDGARPDELDAVEAELGVELPGAYRELLMTANGGYAEYDVEVELGDGRSEYLSFAEIYGADRGKEWGSNPFELMQARTNRGVPAVAVLPIARTGGSSQLYLDLRDGGERVVAFVDGLPGWTGLRQSDSLVTVASSFVEYWERLTIDPDHAQSVIEEFDPRRGDPRFVEDWLDSGLPGWRERLGDSWRLRLDAFGRKD